MKWTEVIKENMRTAYGIDRVMVRDRNGNILAKVTDEDKEVFFLRKYTSVIRTHEN